MGHVVEHAGGSGVGGIGVGGAGVGGGMQQHLHVPDTVHIACT
jgi:hypothetical protein